MRVKTYKGYEINLEEEGAFRAYKNGEEEADDETLNGLETKINKLCKTKFKRFTLYQINDEEGIEKLTVTSVNSVNGSLWTIDAKGEREKHNMTWRESLIKDIPANIPLMKQLKKIYKKKKVLEETEEKVKEALVFLTTEDIGYKRD